jgi:glycosyltransferase involved in cell wall biosynthesis
VVTWLSMHAELVGARAAGARVVAIADSDGQVGFGTHRRHVLYRSVMQHAGLRDRVAAAKFFAQRLLNRSAESTRIVRSIEASDAVLFNTMAAVEHVCRFLREEHRPDLIPRLGVCPYPVDARFLDERLPSTKRTQMVAVGRWDSMQKNAPLLRDALAAYYAGGGTSEAHLFGAGSELFAGLAQRYSQVVCRGVAQVDEVAAAMSQAQRVLLTSRWESGPIVAFEALSQGCTLVSTDIPNMRELVADGRFGEIASTHTPHGFAAAIAGEDERWRSGQRDAEAIAAAWRPAFSAEAVCRRVLDSLVAPEPMLVGVRESAGA